MKFAHIADTHLGYRQFGLHERENDFYDVFDQLINKIIEEDVDFVIHSGDLFETAKPSPVTLLRFQKGLRKLKAAGIPIYTIAGNHESLRSKDYIPPQVLFKRSGVKVISFFNSTYVHDDVFIAGLPYFPKAKDKMIKEKLQSLSQKAKEYDKSILVLHQGIDKYLPFEYELEIGDIPDNFNYYALGHIHNYINDDYGKGKLVYPGSMEIWRTNELADYKTNGKGFVVVDLDGDEPKVKRVKLNLPREFISKNIDYKDLHIELNHIKDYIKILDKKPIVNFTIYNTDVSSKEIHEIINRELNDLCLDIRIKLAIDKEDEEIIINENETLGPKELLFDKLKDYNNEDINNLCYELYSSLSKDNLEEAEKIIENFYEEYFKNLDIVFEDEGDIQTTL